jgi:hypothetical protein
LTRWGWLPLDNSTVATAVTALQVGNNTDRTETG